MCIRDSDRLARHLPMGLADGERLRHLSAVAAPICSGGEPQHRACLRPARPAHGRGAPGPARAPALRMAGVARRGRTMLLALERRRDPAPAPVPRLTAARTAER